jgi:hypothetical protein
MMLRRSGTPQFKAFHREINALYSEVVDPHSFTISTGVKLSAAETHAAEGCRQLADVS